jgi:L-ribulose-5-phosphate 3-epimerase
MKSIKRRTFLSRSVAAAAALGIGTLSSASKTFADQGGEESRRPNPIAVSTYSFWRFKKNLKLPIETCIDEAARMGFDGVDLLLIQMETSRSHQRP